MKRFLVGTLHIWNVVQSVLLAHMNRILVNIDYNAINKTSWQIIAEKTKAKSKQIKFTDETDLQRLTVSKVTAYVLCAAIFNLDLWFLWCLLCNITSKYSNKAINFFYLGYFPLLLILLHAIYETSIVINACCHFSSLSLSVYSVCLWLSLSSSVDFKGNVCSVYHVRMASIVLCWTHIFTSHIGKFPFASILRCPSNNNYFQLLSLLVLLVLLLLAFLVQNQMAHHRQLSITN